MRKEIVRPEEVPEDATYEPDTNTWRLGSPDDAREQIWAHPIGWLLLDARRENGALHGKLYFRLLGASRDGADHYAFGNDLIRVMALPDGDDMGTLDATYEAGELVEARFVMSYGKPMEVEELFATVRAGKLHGPFRWKVTSSKTLFEYQGEKLLRDQLSLPRHAHRIEAQFVDGKPTALTSYDRKGKAIRAQDKIKDWGAADGGDAIAGYLSRGTFAAEAKRFFPEAETVDTVTSSRPLLQKTEHFAPAQRAAVKALDALASGKKLPFLGNALDFHGYGFDCEAEELYGASDPRYMGIASDGSGEMYLLDTTNGEVVVYHHEEGELDQETRFLSLDAFVYAMLRVEAACDGRIPVNELQTAFGAWNLPAAERELERLAEELDL